MQVRQGYCNLDLADPRSFRKLRILDAPKVPHKNCKKSDSLKWWGETVLVEALRDMSVRSAMHCHVILLLAHDKVSVITPAFSDQYGRHNRW